MTDEEVARLAREAGLEAYLAKFPDQLAEALRRAKKLAEHLPRDLVAAEESAHVFKLPADEVRKP